MHRIRFIAQEELSVFDNNGHVLLERPNKLALEDTGIGGMLKHVYSTTILDNLKYNGIEHVIVQPMTNLKSRLYDPLILGRCIMGKFAAMMKVYRASIAEPSDTRNIHFKNLEEAYLFNSEGVLSTKLLCDQTLLAKFNISEMLRTVSVDKEVINIDNGSIGISKVKALKLLVKDFLGCGNNIGAIAYAADEFEELTSASMVIRLQIPLIAQG